MLHRLKNSSDFWKNTFQLIIGTVLAQLIPILLQPLLRRMFTPEDFGVMAVYFSFVSILCVVVSLNYHTTIVLPEKEEDAMSLVMGSVFIAAILSTVILIVFLLFDQFILQLFNLPKAFSFWLWFLPLSIFLNAFNLIFTSWLTRKKAFKKLSLNKVSRRTAEATAQISIGWKAPFFGLNGGVIIGDFVNSLTFLYQYLKTGGILRLQLLRQSKEVLKRYKEFPIVGLGPNLLSTASQFIPVFLVTGLYSTELTGQFDLSRQILALPLALVAASISQVLLQEFSEAARNKASLKSRYKNTSLFLLIIAVSMGIFIHFLGIPIFTFLFGEQWLIGGEITRFLVWSYAIKLVVSPISILLIVFEKLKINAVWQILYFTAMIALYWFVNTDFYTFIKILVAVDLLMYLIYAAIIYRTVQNYEKSIHT